MTLLSIVRPRAPFRMDIIYGTRVNAETLHREMARP